MELRAELKERMEFRKTDENNGATEIGSSRRLF
jgi:hypothetical protein